MLSKLVFTCLSSPAPSHLKYQCWEPEVVHMSTPLTFDTDWMFPKRFQIKLFVLLLIVDIWAKVINRNGFVFTITFLLLFESCFLWKSRLPYEWQVRNGVAPVATERFYSCFHQWSAAEDLRCDLWKTWSQEASLFEAHDGRTQWDQYHPLHPGWYLKP